MRSRITVKYFFVLAILLIEFKCSTEKKSNVENKESGSIDSVQKELVVHGDKEKNASNDSFLTRKPVLRNKVELFLPTSFNLMDAESVSLKYPSKQSGDFEVYTNADGNINIAFEHLPDKATMNDLPKLRELFEQQFNHPSIDFRKSEIKKINGRDFIVIEMVTPAADTEVYNLMFVTSSGGRLLMGTFNCTVDKLKEWQPLAERILGSVKVRD
jgi:hypothetical protein